MYLNARAAYGQPVGDGTCKPTKRGGRCRLYTLYTAAPKNKAKSIQRHSVSAERCRALGTHHFSKLYMMPARAGLMPMKRR